MSELTAPTKTETKTETKTTVADITLIALGRTYARFGYSAENPTRKNIVAILENDEHRAEGMDKTASVAAETVRSYLWSQYAGVTASAAATCDLFYALGRADELGGIADEAAFPEPYGMREYGWFLRDLSDEDHGTVVAYTA